jgi:hypothetical protein
MEFGTQNGSMVTGLIPGTRTTTTVGKKSGNSNRPEEAGF